jgi:hypothetical protein
MLLGIPAGEKPICIYACLIGFYIGVEETGDFVGS